jgi:hypothetical protein
MKHLVCLLFIVVVSGCALDNSEPKDFSIKDANGNIALTHDDVVKLVTEEGQQKFGEVKITVKNVKTKFSKNGTYTSLIEYITSTGQSNNVVVSNNPDQKDQSGSRLACVEWVVSCSGTCCGIMDDPNSDAYQCGCNGTPSGTSCTMNYKCRRQE